MPSESGKLMEPAWLVEQIANGFKIANLSWNDTTGWTVALKKTLSKLLEVSGSNITDVLYSDRESDNHEFLLDVVVWDRADGEGVALAIESEWHQNVAAIEEDFWKLMVVKAPVKIMIFATNQRAHVFTQEAVWKALQKCLLLYRDHVAEETYIFMDFAQPPKGQAWWITIPSTGRLAEIPQPVYVPIT